MTMMGEGTMKRGLVIAALLLVLAALGAGGFYVYRQGAGFPPTPDLAPVPVSVPVPEALPAPELAGDALEPQGGALATLVSFDRTVKSKRSDALAWQDAKERMPLYDNDAVRTFERSKATIAFGSDDLVEVDQNALVVIKPRPSVGDESEISLALLSPELLDSLAAKPAEEQKKAFADAAEKKQVRIRTVGAGKGGKAATRIALRTMPDKSTSVTSLQGAAQLIGPKGEEILLKEKMVTRITPQGTVIQPRVLPPPPSLLLPRDGESFSFLRKTPRVDLTWKPSDRAAVYRVTVASDQGFRKVFADERVKGTSFAMRNLQPGTYYWRVRSQDADGFEGAYSETRSIKAVFDERPPELAILTPPEMYVSPGPQVELKGRTDRGARVKVNGQLVRVKSDGTFSHVVTLKEGINLVSIEAADASGNTGYGKRLITYKGAKRSSAASVSGN